MKFSIDLDWAPDEFGNTLEQVLKDSIKDAVREAFKKELKAHKQQIIELATKQAQKAIAALSGVNMNDVIKQAMQS